ncbi:YggS family pyridoxal phosphate-dependent enzyme [Lewinella sp. 4G2]|uniref:YggS family pyridoxal phosphate-dependent enzyme n=1 Tax=Lewinella sp. 4G2 TaxID=1803372 RepID=UPI0007B4913C|nr:YggS family pyridoxal phosphate-dependent enzyme [Lewinella sp. 4G2]OAV45342.1 YggS family pyridoxal phosphate enzyme [Lewinella sp. 4G2]
MLNVEMYQAVKAEVESANATLVAVTKRQPLEVIQALYDLGQRDFGENRVPELVEKHAALPKDIRWHFIGHLQRNKVKAIAPFIHLIHSGDSARLILEIAKEARKNDRTISVLLQFHIAQEASKYGLSPTQPAAILRELKLDELSGKVNLVGVMGMATYTELDEDIAEEFALLRETFETLKETTSLGEIAAFKEISMGMSGDYQIALQQGSTMVRVGSLLYQ